MQTVMTDAHVRPCTWLGNLESQLFAHLPALSHAQTAAPTIDLTVSVGIQDIAPLHIAVQNDDLETAQALLAEGADVNAEESEVMIAFSYTVKAHSLIAPSDFLHTSILYKSQIILFEQVLSVCMRVCTG